MNFVKVLLFILFAIALPILGIPGNNADQGDATCLTCHENMYNLALKSRYIHNSFLKKNCRTCHVEKNAATTNEGDDQASEGISSKITWLQNHYEPAATHFFLIPSNRVDDTLFVKMKSADGGTTTTSLSLPPLEILPRLINDGRQPEIFDIQFQGVKHGVLSSATVSWKTDEPTDSQIHYSIDTLALKTSLDQQFTTHHTVTISPLTPGKTYTYAVVSKDIHNNGTISPPMTFSTSKDEEIKAVKDDRYASRTLSLTKMSHQLMAVEGRYFLTITAPQATYMNIGSRRDLQIRRNGSKGKEAASIPAKHVSMKNAADTNITSCLGCHKDYKSTSSHPINVGPKRGMTFPDDYPVLADGKMHCTTCHEPHASNNEARIRRPTKQKLCVGCHKGYE